MSQTERRNMTPKALAIRRVIGEMLNHGTPREIQWKRDNAPGFDAVVLTPPQLSQLLARAYDEGRVFAERQAGIDMQATLNDLSRHLPD